MSDGRRVLFVSHTAPAPPVSGERQRVFNLMRELVERDWEVSLFCIEHGPLAAAELEQLHELAPGGLLVQPQPHPAWRVPALDSTCCAVAPSNVRSSSAPAPE